MKKISVPKTCSVRGCFEMIEANDLCHRHYVSDWRKRRRAAYEKHIKTIEKEQSK